MVGLGRVELPTNGLGNRSGPPRQHSRTNQTLQNTKNFSFRFGLSCSHLAGVIGQFIGQSDRKPRAEGCNRIRVELCEISERSEKRDGGKCLSALVVRR